MSRSKKFSDEEQKEKARARSKRWREQNKDKCLDYNKEYYKKNQERKKVYSREWRRENKDKYYKYKKEWEENNYELTRTINNRASLKWQKQNRGKANSELAKYRAKLLKATPSWLSKEHRKEIKNIYIKAKMMEESDGIKRHVDHIVPLQSNDVCGLHVPWNLQILTARENISKSNNFNGVPV